MNVTVPCLCSGKQRHKNDTITLRDAMPFRDAVAIRNEVGMLYIEEPDATLPDIMGVLVESYLIHGIEGWSLRDGKDPMPATRENIRKHLLTNLDVAETVGDAADELYRESVMLPLLRKAFASSPATPTDASTSVPEGLSTETENSTENPISLTLHQQPSKRSLTITSPMDGIEPISASPDGDSRSSPKSA